MRHPFYSIYAILLLCLMAFAEYTGMPLLGARVNEAKVVPKTVRDNPGAYRSAYGGYTHYVGGK